MFGQASSQPAPLDNEARMVRYHEPAVTERPFTIETVSDDVAVVLREKTGMERLEIASRMFSSARRMLINHLRSQHPDRDDFAIEREAARRLSHGAV